MNSRLRKLAGALGLMLLGTAVPAALIWNPRHWSWADDLTSRLHSGSPAAAAQKQSPAASPIAPQQRKILYWGRR